MIELIKSTLSENQIVFGFLMMWAVTIGGILLRRTPSKIYSFLRRRFSFTIILTDHEGGHWSRGAHDAVKDELAKISNGNAFNTMQVVNAAQSNGKEDKVHIANLILVPDSTFRFLKIDGFWCAVSFGENTNAQIKSTDGGMLYNKRISITTLLHNKNNLKRWLVDTCVEVEEEGMRVHLHSSTRNGYVRTVNYETIKAMSINENTTNTLDKYIDRFMNEKDWYARVGKERRLNILAYGEPGTGKTSLAYYIALKTGLDVRVVSLSTYSIDTINELITRMNGRKAIYVFDDVDTVAGTMSREGKPSSVENRAVTLDILLSMFDGPLQITNSICILTTNHIDKLDSALHRDRRIDLKLEVVRLTKVEVAKYLARVFEMGLEDMASRLNDDLSIAGSKMAGIYDASPDSLETVIANINKHVK